MVAPKIGSVVLVRFPFSDLTQTKLRPAIVLADAGRDDWILCQATSRAYSDSRAVTLTNSDFISGGLQRNSFARPAKLFTGNSALFVGKAGVLRAAAIDRVRRAVRDLFTPREEGAHPS